MPLVSARDKKRIAVVAAALGIALIVHLGVGSYFWFAPWDVVREILRGPSADGSQINQVVWNLRLQRTLGCLCIGGVLGSVGAAFQALFRNPIAEPYVVGVSSGAAVGGTLAFALGIGSATNGLIPALFATATGICAVLLVMSLARIQGVVNVPNLLLAGVVMGSLLSSVTTLILLLAGQDTNRILRWLVGSTSEMLPERLYLLAPVWIIGMLVLQQSARELNAFAIGEDTAKRLGVSTDTLKWRVLLTGSTMVAVTVGTAGMIGFIGLVAPHLARRLTNADLRSSHFASSLIGSILLLVADVIAQRALGATELPVGTVTALIGAPFLLVLLRQQR